MKLVSLGANFKATYQTELHRNHKLFSPILISKFVWYWAKGSLKSNILTFENKDKLNFLQLLTTY